MPRRVTSSCGTGVLVDEGLNGSVVVAFVTGLDGHRGILPGWVGGRAEGSPDVGGLDPTPCYISRQDC